MFDVKVATSHVIWIRICVSVQVSKAEVLLKGARLIVRHGGAHQRDFWELHFIGEPVQISQKLFDAITSLQKKGKTVCF